MCMMIMKRVISKAFKGSMSEKVSTIKEFLAEIEQTFVKNKKAESDTLLINLISVRCKGKDKGKKKKNDKEVTDSKETTKEIE